MSLGHKPVNVIVWFWNTNQWVIFRLFPVRLPSDECYSDDASVLVQGWSRCMTPWRPIESPVIPFLNSPLVKYNTTNDVGYSISNQQLTIKWLPFVSAKLFCQCVDFLQTFFLYRGFPHTKVAHARHGKFPGRWPSFKVEEDSWNWIQMVYWIGQWSFWLIWMNSSLPGQNGRDFADDIFICIVVNETFCILIEILLKFVSKGLIDNDQAMFKIMAWCRRGDKPLSEPMRTWFTDAYIRH